MEACLGFHISCAATYRTSRTFVALEKVKMTGCLGISPNARASSTGRSVLGSGHFQQQDRMRMLSQFKEGVQIRGMGSKSTSRYGPSGVHIFLVDLDRGSISTSGYGPGVKIYGGQNQLGHRSHLFSAGHARPAPTGVGRSLALPLVELYSVSVDRFC